MSSLRTLVIAALALAPTASALAGTVTLTMSRNSLNNVNDVSGIWQLEGGDLLLGSRDVGDYACTRRTVDGGTNNLNTAMLTCTMFLPGGAGAPDNVTYQGAHDYSTGGFKGAVSAASAAYAFVIGADVAGSAATNTVTLSW